ncbi:hypothetical protein [Pseudooctadecabacter sp.]|uniref:hypothetical protein n=1 Tax=Pseudooctadecabacter sp. TaxID=1966338 RepID=UPI0035C7DBEC
MRIVATLLATWLSGTATAQIAVPCDWQARADAIVEPWEENSATFADGAVRVALLDTIEPAAAAFHLLILHPPFDEVGARTCSTVGLDEGLGYAGMLFDDLTSEYDPARGLIFTIPAIIYLPEQSFQNSALLTITVNQATGDVTVDQQLGRE